jgi:hypothetical protein
MTKRIKHDDLKLLTDVAYTLSCGVDVFDALELLQDVYRLGYVARKLETLGNKLTIEKLKGRTLNG